MTARQIDQQWNQAPGGAEGVMALPFYTPQQQKISQFLMHAR